jgi:hypothetical protein
MPQSSINDSFPISVFPGAKSAIRRMPRSLQLLAAAAMLATAGYQLSLALQTPGQSIRDALTAAAEDAAHIPSTRRLDDVRLALARHFTGQDVRIEPSGFPSEIAVVLDGLDRATCLEARQMARRIEGDVVIALDGYGTAADCLERNAMTWHILP